VKHPTPFNIWRIPMGYAFAYVIEVEDDKWYFWYSNRGSFKEIIYKSFINHWKQFAIKPSNHLCGSRLIIEKIKLGDADDCLIFTNQETCK
jgi:hypothetical protein